MLSILIPTLNRPQFVARALEYYAAAKFEGCVYIGDSSEGDPRQRTEAAAARARPRVNVRYEHFPKAEYPNEGHCLKAMGERADTPFVVFSGDDDFCVPAALRKCVQFLEGHADYAAVNGVSVYVRLDTDGPMGRAVEAGYVGAHRLLADAALVRWIGYARQPISSQYYVHRLDAWRYAYAHVPEVPLKYLGPEFLPCSMTAIWGKVTELEGLGTIVQQRNAKDFGWHRISMYDLMTGPQWTASARALRSVIADALVERGGLAREDALAEFDREWWRHLLFMLQWHYELRHREPLNPYDKLKRNRRLVGTYLALKRVRAGKRHRRISLHSLLDPRDALHADFLPVYRAITGDDRNHV